MKTIAHAFIASCLASSLLCCKSEKQESVTDSDTTYSVPTDTAVMETVSQNDYSEEDLQARYEDFFPPQALYRVIRNGAELRERPHQSARVIGSIPYGRAVTVVTRPFSMQQFDSLRSANTESVSVYVKVSSDGNTGYLLNSDMLRTERDDFDGQDGPLLFLDGTSCVENFGYVTDLKYYGVFINDGASLLKKVAPTFSVNHTPFDEIGNTEYYKIEAGTEDSPLFIVGVYEELKEGELRSVDTEKESDVSTKAYTLKLEPLESEYGQPVKISFTGPDGKLLIDPLETPGLMWCGDLNGDELFDFVYLEGSEENGKVTLSLGTTERPLKPAAYFSIAYCD